MVNKNTYILIGVIVLIIGIYYFKDYQSQTVFPFGYNAEHPIIVDRGGTNNILVLEDVSPINKELFMKITEKNHINPTTNIKFKLHQEGSMFIGEKREDVFPYCSELGYTVYKNNQWQNCPNTIAFCRYNEQFSYMQEAYFFMCCQAGGWNLVVPCGGTTCCAMDTGYYSIQDIKIQIRFNGITQTVFDKSGLVKDTFYNTDTFGNFINTQCVDKLISGQLTSCNIQFLFTSGQTGYTEFYIDSLPITHQDYSLVPSSNKLLNLEPDESRTVSVTLEHLDKTLAGNIYDISFDITGIIGEEGLKKNYLYQVEK